MNGLKTWIKDGREVITPHIINHYPMFTVDTDGHRQACIYRPYMDKCVNLLGQEVGIIKKKRRTWQTIMAWVKTKFRMA